MPTDHTFYVVWAVASFILWLWLTMPQCKQEGEHDEYWTCRLCSLVKRVFKRGNRKATRRKHRSNRFSYHPRRP